MFKHLTRLLAMSILGFAGLVSTVPRSAAAEAPRVLTRVFFQDRAEGVVKWADVHWGFPPQLGPVETVAGSPKLDAERQSLVQMRASGGQLLVGVRDNSGGFFRSGWVLIDSGVDQDSHGDHSHWSYPRAPRVRSFALDEKQGNPAHVYTYDNVFYVANDKLNGYTRLDPAMVTEKDTPEQIRRRAAFHLGGGNHITLAVSGGYGFSAWTDREGPNRGRVDITSVKPSGNKNIAASFQLALKQAYSE